MNYHVYFRRPDDCVVYTSVTEHHEVSLVHRGRNGRWHCALCDVLDCRHTRAAEQAEHQAGGDAAGGTLGGVFTIPLPNG